MRVLVAEDSPTIRSMVEHSLRAEGHEVVLAHDGIQAVEAAYRELPDCIISDIVMPRMNGYQVIRLLKADETMKGIPIVLMTTKTEASSRFWAMKAGADEYLTKPFQPSELLEIMQRIQPLLERSAKPARPVEITFDTIVRRTNELLDQELMRSTLLNEAASLVSSIHNLPKTMYGLLLLFHKLLAFDIGGLLLTDYGLYLHLPRPQSEEMANQFEGKITVFGRKLGLSISRVDLHREYFGEVIPKQEGELAAFEARTLGQEEVVAVVAFGMGAKRAFAPEDMAMMELLLPSATLLVENAVLHQKTQALAITDGLTQLSTHRHLQESLDREINRSKRYMKGFSILLLDIDNFKHLNDTYGHLAGDEVLKQLALIMRSCVRDTDVVARYGGEEFMCILSETGLEGAQTTAERIRQAVELHPFVFEGRTQQVTVSIGIAHFPDHADAKPALIAAADKALYRAKTGGKNRVELA